MRHLRIPSLLPVLVATAGCTAMGLFDETRCDPDFWTGTKASVQFDWLIDGTPADASFCSIVGGAQVRMSVAATENGRDWIEDFTWPCSSQVADTGFVFDEGTYYLAWELVDISGAPVSSTQSSSHRIVAGTNHVATIDF